MTGAPDGGDRRRSATPGLGRGPGGRARSAEIGRAAREQVGEMTGRDTETVSAMRRDGEGWVVDVDVVESRRVPDSTDRLATYRATLDEDGELVGLRRVRSFVRSWVGGDGDV